MKTRKDVKRTLLAMLTASAVMPCASALADVAGDLSPNRSSAELTVAVQCNAPVDAGDSKTGSLTVHLFQPSGRLLNIGVGTVDLVCDGTQANVVVTVDAIPGLKFKPGPATVILKQTEQTTDASGAVTDSTTSETGDKVNLRP